jgi:unsaturated chondroitin disaccharide hydrolase
MIPKIPEIKNPERYSDFDLPREKLEYALSEALKKIDYAIPQFQGTFPSHASVNNVYQPSANTWGWNCGFWTGVLWHAYEMSGDEKYKKEALSHVPSYLHRIENKIGVNHHDMGFVFTPSCVAAWKLAGCEDAKRAAILAADNLLTRYKDKGEFIQAWGDINDPLSYRLIVDCLLNVPLLYWASEVTGDGNYQEKGYKHFNTTAEVCCREDASTYHTYYFDPETGELILGDIIISVDKVEEQALAYGHSKKREFAFLIAHSMLHLCGYDHMEPGEASIMEVKQEAALTKLGITRDSF